MKFPSRLSIVFACLLLAGCSTLKLAYYFADNLIMDRVDNFLNWEYSEEAEAGQQFARMMAWHRQEMLPLYADFLTSKAEIATQNQWSEEQISTAFGQFRALIRQTIHGASPYFGQVLVIHSEPAKLQYLEARLNEALEERLIDERAETLEISIKEWIDRQTTNLERFIGPLNDTQRDILKNLAPTDAFAGMRWLENRAKRQEAFIAFMQDQPDARAIADFLSVLLITPHEIVDPTYEAISEQRWAVRENLYFQVLNSLDETQREVLVTNLRDYAAEFRELSENLSS